MNALAVGLAASWRLMLMSLMVIVIPTTIVSVAMVLAGLRSGPWVFTTAVVVTFTLSLWVHEVAHAAIYRLLACRLGIVPEIFGKGSWTRAELFRWSLGHERDALISLAGPAAGTLLILPLLAWPDGFESWPVCLLPLVHLVSLSPRYQDGAQVHKLWKKYHAGSY